MFKATQKTLRSVILFSAVFFTLLFALVTWFWFGIHIQKEHETSLAFWLSHDFSTGVQNPALLATQFEGLPVTDLYFHVGPLELGGTLPQDLKLSASTFATLPSTDYAWIGQVRSEIDLENPEVRAAIVDSSQWLISQGFEGIHVDIEPIRGDDTAFVALLQELKTTLPSVPLSVAMDEWQPDQLTQWVANYFDVSIESYWSTEQVQSVLPFVDQLVVMTYDTGFKDPDLYSWWVEQQTVALSNRVGSDVKLFVGVPCYSEGAHFDPEAENLGSALLGYDRGVQNLRSDASTIAGLAIYPYWEMDKSEWATLKDNFQKSTP